MGRRGVLSLVDDTSTHLDFPRLRITKPSLKSTTTTTTSITTTTTISTISATTVAFATTTTSGQEPTMAGGNLYDDAPVVPSFS